MPRSSEFRVHGRHLPTPWVQLNFIYGNSTVSGTTILAAQTLMDAAGYYDIPKQLGVNDAFVTVNATKYFGFPFLLHVGAYTGRYGAMGRTMRGATPLRSSRARTPSGRPSQRATKLGDYFLVWRRDSVANSGGRPWA